jgi:hypothetical protein
MEKITNDELKKIAEDLIIEARKKGCTYALIALVATDKDESQNWHISFSGNPLVGDGMLLHMDRMSRTGWVQDKPSEKLKKQLESLIKPNPDLAVVCVKCDRIMPKSGAEYVIKDEKIICKVCDLGE